LKKQKRILPQVPTNFSQQQQRAYEMFHLQKEQYLQNQRNPISVSFSFVELKKKFKIIIFNCSAAKLS